jgi:hypothetical protein
MIKLHQEHFEAWLFSQPPDRVIKAGDCRDCFLCSFIKETTAIKRVDMDFHSYNIEAQPVYTPLPSWATRLINHNWLHSRPRSGGRNYRITVAEMQRRYREVFSGSFEPINQQPSTKNQTTNTTIWQKEPAAVH